MIDLYFIGIGMGNPDHLTRQAIAELQTADVILIPHKGAQKSDLADLRKTICEKCLEPIPPLVYFDLPKRDSKTKTYLEGLLIGTARSPKLGRIRCTERFQMVAKRRL